MAARPGSTLKIKRGFNAFDKARARGLTISAYASRSQVTLILAAEGGKGEPEGGDEEDPLEDLCVSTVVDSAGNTQIVVHKCGEGPRRE